MKYLPHDAMRWYHSVRFWIVLLTIVTLWVSFGPARESCREVGILRNENYSLNHVSCTVEKKAIWVQVLSPFNTIRISDSTSAFVVYRGQEITQLIYGPLSQVMVLDSSRFVADARYVFSFENDKLTMVADLSKGNLGVVPEVLGIVDGGVLFVISDTLWSYNVETNTFFELTSFAALERDQLYSRLYNLHVVQEGAVPLVRFDIRYHDVVRGYEYNLKIKQLRLVGSLPQSMYWSYFSNSKSEYVIKHPLPTPRKSTDYWLSYFSYPAQSGPERYFLHMHERLFYHWLFR